MNQTLEAERLEIIGRRREALQEYLQADQAKRPGIHDRIILPLNRRLLDLNRRLGA